MAGTYIKIASWNIAKAFNDKRAATIEKGIDRLDADIIVLSEAFFTDHNTPPGFVEDRVKAMQEMADRLGYDYFSCTPYNGHDYPDNQPVDYDLYLVALSRFPVAFQVKRLDARDSLFITYRDDQWAQDITIVGTHFDDLSETSRQAMAAAALKLLDLSKPTVIMGDMNSMHGNTWQALLVESRPGRWALRHMPTDFTKSLGERLYGMAAGTTQKMLSNSGLEDADPKRRSTFIYKFILFAQLDHILTANLNVLSFDNHWLGGSDHKAISAEISL
jgi:endonuclease/exonuclease/phosphatase family metal-dependent hydrolase